MTVVLRMQSTADKDASSKDSARPDVKTTSRKYTSRQESALPPKEGYVRIWTKEEFGWSYIDYDNSEFQNENGQYPLLKF